MPMLNKNPIFCAIDTKDLGTAEKIVLSLKGRVHGVKLGLEFFLAHGAAGYLKIAALGLPIFLDLKLHDIPNTVSGAITSLLSLKPNFLTLHASGGPAMMRDALKAAESLGTARPKLLGVTVLTSLDPHDLEAVGQDKNTKEQVLRLAKLAKNEGLDGVICSPEEVSTLRAALGPDFILMVPGIRPSWSSTQDQKRVMTPKEAVMSGATYLVIGRPITGATDPADAARRIVEEIAA